LTGKKTVGCFELEKFGVISGGKEVCCFELREFKVD
jgi:hypothetical protein